jgi:alkylated DNA repair dioxygenase AlkB
MLFEKKHEELALPNAELKYFPAFLDDLAASRLFDHLLNSTPWRQDDITVFGKTYPQPRLTALYSTTPKPYSYSNITMYPEAFPQYLLDLKKAVETACGREFNTLLLNLYRDGSDSNGWHADNERELGKNPVIASLSLGEERPFHFKHRYIKEERHKLILQHGSLLLMSGEMQHYWLHQIAKTKRVIGPRINLTFRTLIL